MMQLENSIGHGQADAAAAGFGGEVEVKDLLAQVFGDTGALIGDADEGIAGAGRGGGQTPRCIAAIAGSSTVFQNSRSSSRVTSRRAALRHGLRAILNHVEQGLLEEVGVEVCHQWGGGR